MDSVGIQETYTMYNITLLVAEFLMRTKRYHAAIEFYKELLILTKNLTLSSATDLDSAKMRIHSNLGYAYFHEGYYNESLTNNKLAFRISKQMGDKTKERKLCDNIACAFKALGRLDKAMEYFEKSLYLLKETGDSNAEAKYYCELGSLRHGVGQYENAVECELKAVKMAKETGDRKTELNALFNLSKVLSDLGKLNESRLKRGKALEISEEIGDGLTTAKILRLEAAAACGQIGQGDKLLKLLQKSLQLSKEIGDREGEGKTCFGIGGYFALNNNMTTQSNT